MPSALLAAVLWIAAPAIAAASAFTPHPSATAGKVAVEPSGDGLFAWSEQAGVVGFCRVPRRARACAEGSYRRLVATDDYEQRTGGPEWYRVHVFTGAPGSVVVATTVQGTFGEPGGNEPPKSPLATLAWTSTDGGSTFAGPEMIGRVPLDDAAAGPDGGITGAGLFQSFEGPSVQYMALGGYAGIDRVVLEGAPFGQPYLGADVAVAGGTPTVLAREGLRRYAGVGDINDVANWTAPARMPGNLLAASSAGAYMATERSGDWGVQKLTASGFGPYRPAIRDARRGRYEQVGRRRKRVGQRQVVDVRFFREEGPNHRLHLLWVTAEQLASGRRRHYVRHSHSKHGKSWSRPETLATSVARGGVALTGLAAAVGGKGFAVWADGGKPYGPAYVAQLGTGRRDPR